VSAGQKDKALRRWCAAVTFAALALLAAAPLPHAWTNWRYSRAIELPLTDAKRLAGIIVPQEVYSHAQAGLSDVRLIDDTGAEVPYAQFAREGSANTVALSATLLENSFAPGRYTQMVFDLRQQTPFHNSVRIETAEPDFIEWVHVEASDDARVWRIVQERAPIFRFRKEAREGTQTVHYSENNARYLRIHILDGERQFPASRAEVFYHTAAPAEETPIAANIESDHSGSASQTAWRIDVGTLAPSIRAARFAVGPAEFSRNVEVSASDDGVEWTQVANGQIYRFRQENTVEEQLRVPVRYAVSGRYLRVAVLNDNDPALPGVTLTLLMAPQHIVFEQQPQRSYRLLYGQSLARTPQYDLERRLDRKQEDAATIGQVGAEEENSDYSDPRPWTEKNTYFLWIVMGIAVLLIGYSAIRSLRKTGAIPPAKA